MEPGSPSNSPASAVDLKNVSCQELLKLRPACHGWLRRKTTFHQLGSKMEEKLNISRKHSLMGRISWYQRYVLLVDSSMYVFSEETARRAQKVIQLADYDRISDAPDELNSEVLWPFKLEPREPRINHTQYFSATSEDELKKWQRALGSEIKSAGARSRRPRLNSDESDSGCDDGSVGDSNSLTGKNRPLPPPPSGEEAFRGKKKPVAIPTTPGKRPACASRSHDLPARTTPQHQPVPEAEDDDTYEIAKEPSTATESAMWNGPADEASRIMAGITENGVFLIRRSVESDGYTLMVIVDGKTSKFKILENKQTKKLLFQNRFDFDTLPDLVSYYTDHNLPNKSISLSKPFSDVNVAKDGRP